MGKKATGFEETFYQKDLFGNPIKPDVEGIVSQRFGVPPFSILNTSSDTWQNRKKQWKALGLSGYEGREDALTFEGAKGNDFLGRQMSDIGGTSEFDPCVAELCYRWLCPPDGQIVDPFAGGAVRGVVAKALGLKYWGCDLNEKQIKVNKKVAGVIYPNSHGIEWLNGDSMQTLASAPNADIIFSCPPYGDLEKYTDDPNDISNMEYHTFVAAYKRIILAACLRLKNDRFACFVVGDYRDKKGYLRSLVSDTIRAFEECGLRYYNSVILQNPIGTARLRVTKQFENSRKFAKIHQDMLVFVKGDPKKASNFNIVIE